jgi:hypothetical protein
VGRASRKRAEQRSAAGQPRPLPEHSERSQTAAAGRPERSERVWDALARESAGRPPFRCPPDTALGGLNRLRDMSTSRVELDALIADEVIELVRIGTDWGTIGRALGVSRQAARQRYGATR